MKTKFATFLFFLTLSCQGPWSYWPEGSENYQGIWTYAYVISGRPVEEVCFDKMHTLKEVRMPGFALYEDASVKIAGTFSGGDTSFFLWPKSDKPNCFYGPWDLIAEAGGNYELDVTMVWDSAGEKVTSHFSAKTYIPQKFKIQRAYDLEGQEYEFGRDSYSYYDSEGQLVQYDGDSYAKFSYLPPPMDLQSTYYIPEYSSDVGGVLVSVDLRYIGDIYWGKSTIGETVEKFVAGADTAFYAKFGYGYTVFFAENLAIAGMKKEIDSIPVIGMMMPAYGEFSLLFYATTKDYAKFRNTFVNGSDDSRMEAVYNINGGAGIFAGMMVDTVGFKAIPSPDVDLYSYNEAQEKYCYTYELDPNLGLNSNVSQYQTRRECIEYWDEAIQCEFQIREYGTCSEARIWHNWYNIPYEQMRTVLSYREFITWCEFRDFPIYKYPPCGSAMVRFYKMGAKSPILEREVKNWCEVFKDDLECLAIL